MKTQKCTWIEFVRMVKFGTKYLADETQPILFVTGI